MDTESPAEENINIEKVKYLHVGDVHHHTGKVEHFYCHQAPSDAQLHDQRPQQQERDAFHEVLPEIRQQQLAKLESEADDHCAKFRELSVPEIYPKLVETDIYNPGKERDFEKLTANSDLNWVHGEQVLFEEIIAIIKEGEVQGVYLALIGAAGCGKTTLSKRLCQCLIQHRFVIYIRFMYLSYGDEKLTLQELLLDRQFPDVSKSDCDVAFQWMEAHQSSCVFIFDGLDQANWSLEKVKPVEARHDTPLRVQQLMANLCSRKFFAKSSLIITSRPHSLLSIPVELRPKRTVCVQDLSSENVKVLFRACAGEKADELWENVTTKSPQLLDFCHNPMVLQFVVYACLRGDAIHVHTLTEIFEAVLQQLCHSQHARGDRIRDLKKPLGKMAYRGMIRRTVVFAYDDLVKVGLEDVNIQDVVVKVARHSWLSIRAVFDGTDVLFYFFHQMLQEIFAAYYICMFMSFDEFAVIVDDVVEDDHWNVVRRFLCGLLLGNENASLISTESVSPRTSSSSEPYENEVPGAHDSKGSNYVVQVASSTTPNAPSTSTHEERKAIQQKHGKRETFFRKAFSGIKGRKNKAPASVGGSDQILSGESFVANKDESRHEESPNDKSTVFFMKFSRFFQSLPSKRDIRELLLDLQECSEDVRDKVAQLPPEELPFSYTPLSSTTCHALIDFLPRVETPHMRLALNNSDLDSDKLKLICEAIRSMKQKLHNIDLSCNKFDTEDVIVICGVFPKVDQIFLYNCELNSASIRIVKEELQKLQHPPELRGLKDQ